jgi:hypothetical protein
MLLATADSRMYRDKTRRKRRSAGLPLVDDHQPPVQAAPSLAEIDVRKAAVGVL